MAALRLTREQVWAMVEQVRAEVPYEACGLLAGEGDRVRLVLPVPNRASNPLHHFRMDETVLLKALREIDRQKLTLLAIYHSHPKSDPIPSSEDINAARQYPNVVQVLIGLNYPVPRLKGWSIRAGVVETVDLLLDGRQPDELENEPLSPAQRYAILLAALLAVALMVGLSLSLLPPAPVLTPTGFR